VLGILAPLSPRGDTAGVDWYDSGIGFAATLADIPEILAGMKEGKTYSRSMLGIGFSPADLGPGATLTTVRRGTAAHEARLRKGDKILAVDGQKVRHAMHLGDLIGRNVGGEWVLLEVRKKDGEKLELLIQLDKV
jgi:serine protease Do